MVPLYERLIAGCTSENQRNRVHIRLENRMTPEEAVELWSHYLGRRYWRENAISRARSVAEPRLAHLGHTPKPESSRGTLEHTRYWLGTLRDQYLLAGRARPEPFRRHRLTHGISRYSAGGPSRDRTLLLCFSGDWHRMMMPMSTFLQHLPAARCDVAFLRTERGHGYRAGIRGAGDDLPSSVMRLPTLLGLDRYSRVATMGTSAGGLPALIAALLLGVDAALVVGGNSPQDERWAGSLDGHDADVYLADLANRAARVPRTTIVHSEGNERDAISALTMASLLPTESVHVMPVAGADHNSLIHVTREGALARLLASSMLTQGVESGNSDRGSR